MLCNVRFSKVEVERGRVMPVIINGRRQEVKVGGERQTEVGGDAGSERVSKVVVGGRESQVSGQVR